jgi:twitching motility protein PilT
MARLHGNIVKIEGFDVRTPEQNEAELLGIMNETQQKEFHRRGMIDLSYGIEGVGRFRVNIHREGGGVSGAFRIIPSEIRTAENIGFPETVKELSRREQGLFLVTGPSGCGKSTTLGALVDLINRERVCHVITIEKPIELRYTNKKAYIEQREVGVHTKSFASALRAVVRENADVIVVGAMPDLETVSLALSAAETGHLVFSTLHTRSAAKTVSRIISAFPPDEQLMMQTRLGDSLVGILSQQLIRDRAGTDMVPAIEVMINTPMMAGLIRNGDSFRIPTTMQTGKKFGMQLMDDHIIELLREGKVDPKVAQTKIEDKVALREYLLEQQKEAKRRKTRA